MTRKEIRRHYIKYWLWGDVKAVLIGCAIGMALIAASGGAIVGCSL